jgi:hypothetical protein
MTRDPARYPASTSYVRDPQARPCSAGALMLAYCHLSIIQCATSGMPLPDARHACHALYENLQRAADELLAPVEPTRPPITIMGLPLTGPAGWYNNCLIEGCAATATILRQHWDPKVVAPYADITITLDAGPDVPTTWTLSAAITRMHPADLDTVCWLVEALRLAAHGTQLPRALRVAYDQAQGRPRRERAPLEQAWLASTLEHALERCWWGLLHATRFGSVLWLLTEYIDPYFTDTHRPTVSDLERR